MSDETVDHMTEGDPEENGQDMEDQASSGGSSSDSSRRRYVLTITQQPEVSAAFENNVLSRLPLSPPLIVMLEVSDPDGNILSIDAELPYLIAHLYLLSEDGTESLDLVENPIDENGPPVRMLYGTLVSSAHMLSNLEGGYGTYFVYPDVSVKLTGRYSLGVGLMRLANRHGDPTQHQTLASIITAPFDIVTVSEYNAPQATELSQSFHSQGTRTGIPPS